MNPCPQLTSLKSTRQVSGPKTIKPTDYFVCKKPAQLGFGDINEWKAFPIILERNSSKLSNLPLKQNDITSILEANSIHARYENSPSGHCSLSVGRTDAYLTDKSDNVLLIGHENRTALDTLDNNTNSINHPEVLSKDALNELLRVLAINGLSYGYFSNNSYTWFVKLGTYRNKFEVMVSAPIPAYTKKSALEAVCLEAYFGKQELKRIPPFELIPIAVETPSICPLSSYEEGSIGHLKWWVVRKITRQLFTISIQGDIRNVLRINEGFLRQGYIQINSIDSNHQPKERFVDLILASGSSAELLYKSVSMMSFLNDKKIKCVPEVIAFGNVYDFQVCALEPFGQPISLENLKDATIEHFMHAALSELHDCGIILTEINLDMFRLDIKAGSPIKIFGFSKARLVRNVPFIARQNEHDSLTRLIASLK